MVNKIANVFLTGMLCLSASHVVMAEATGCYQFVNDDATLVADATACQHPDLSYQQQFELDSDEVGSFVYKVLNNPNRMRNQVAGSVILFTLDYVGLGGIVRDGVYFIKQNSRFTFGDCGKARLRANRVTAVTCLAHNSFLEFNSSYDLDSVQLRFNWSI